MHRRLSRREFFGATAVAAGVLARSAAVAGPATAPPTRIRKVYLAPPSPTWPRPDLDIKAEIRRIEDELARPAPGLDGVRLDGGDLYRIPDDVPGSAHDLGACDGLLVFRLGAVDAEILDRLAALALPTAFCSLPSAGHAIGAPGRAEQVSCGAGFRPAKRCGQNARATQGRDGIAEACRRIRRAHLSGIARRAWDGEGSPRVPRRVAAKEC